VDKGSKFANFLKEKQREFAYNITTSFLAAIALATIYGTQLRGEGLYNALADACMWMFGGLIGTAVLSLAAK